MTTSPKYSLWLPNWYPSRLEPFNGDFLQRHAQSASITEMVQVLYVLRDRDGVLCRSISREEHREGLLHETLIYYNSPQIAWGVADRLLSFLWYLVIHFRECRKLIRKQGKPQLIHLHIAGKIAVVAYMMSRLWRIPLLYSEQWTYFLPEAKPSLWEASIIKRKAYAFFLKRVAGVSVVSDYLGKCLQRCYGGLQYRVIPNVVDTKRFYPEPDSKDLRKRNHFVHVSDMNYQKNIKDILLAFSLLKERGIAFQLTLLGPINPEVQQAISQQGLSDRVILGGAVAHTAIAASLRHADALILYSRYETFGCVVIEANASGLPVIASDYPVMRELIEEAVNGYLVKGEDPEMLADKISWFIAQTATLPAHRLHELMHKKYEPEVVAKLFSAWYAQWG